MTGGLTTAVAAELRTVVAGQLMAPEQLAALAGVPVRVVEDGLAGRRLSVEDFGRLCAVLEVSPADVAERAGA